MRRTVAWISAFAFALWPVAHPAAAPRCYPTSRFVVQTGGMVQDTLTQLVWQQDGSSTRTGCSGSSTLTCTRAEAQAYCAGLTLGGVSGWRLPTVRELSSLVDFTIGYPGPTINATAFPNTPAEFFWTSSPYAGSFDLARGVNLDYGRSYADVVGRYGRVRCVR